MHVSSYPALGGHVKMHGCEYPALGGNVKMRVFLHPALGGNVKMHGFEHPALGGKVKMHVSAVLAYAGYQVFLQNSCWKHVKMHGLSEILLKIILLQAVFEGHSIWTYLGISGLSGPDWAYLG